MTQLRLGLRVRAGASDGLRAAVAQLGARTDLVADRDGGRFDAIVTDDAGFRSDAAALVRWIATPDACARAARGALALIATPRVAREARVVSPIPVLAFGSTAAPSSCADARLVLPFTRARIRRARGLPGPAVARRTGGRWTWNGSAVGDSAAPTVAALADVVITDDAAAALLAAAWGAAVVTTFQVRAATGLPGSPGGEEDPEVAARALVGDRAALAIHARRCHDCFASDHDPDGSVRRLTELLREARVLRPSRDYSQALATLGTSFDAPIRHRSHRALDSLRRT